MAPSLDSFFTDNDMVLDSVYEIVNISEFEKHLISTPEFQRLRGIKQLGFVNFVYPAAEHSRFIHSIGVCHQAKRLFAQVNKNISEKTRYQLWRKDYRKEELGIPEMLDESERIVISAAALLHDLPHSPFSHEIERIGDKGAGIPIHDDFANNPTFFKYMFDESHSQLAQVICMFNERFFKQFQSSPWYTILKANLRDSLTDDGYILVSPNKGTESPVSGNYIQKRLPLLGVMIFEIHIFEKSHSWIKGDKKDKFYKENFDGIEIKTNWDERDTSTLNFRPLFGWFRPYRKDIITNTICADLIDYLIRDGKNTGIGGSVDYKFLDRMAILKAVHFNKEANKLNVDRKNIPDSFEHIVFDIFDYKRGYIRQSIITEIIASLQKRYLLAERVYNHRIVEGARSMLQEVSKLLAPLDNHAFITLKDLHPSPLQAKAELKSFAPSNDVNFIAWVKRIEPIENPSEEGKIANRNLSMAKNLIHMIDDRRIFREVVVIDGIHGYNHESLAGRTENCISLEEILTDEAIREQIYLKVKEIINTEYELVSLKLNSETSLSDAKKMRAKLKLINEFGAIDKINGYAILTIGIRNFEKRYKVPRVLVVVPRPVKDKDLKPLGHEVQPLFACQDPPQVKERLKAMIADYDSLWKVYFFLHPVFHDKDFANVYMKIAEAILEIIRNETKNHWKNSIDLTELLPNLPVDQKVLLHQNRKLQQYNAHIEYIEEGKDSTEKQDLSDTVVNADLQWNEFVEQLLSKIKDDLADAPSVHNLVKKLKKPLLDLTDKNYVLEEVELATMLLHSDYKRPIPIEDVVEGKIAPGIKKIVIYISTLIDEYRSKRNTLFDQNDVVQPLGE